MTKIPIFDIGDTLLPSHDNINRTVREILVENGYEDPKEIDINSYNIYKTSDVQKWLNKNNYNNVDPYIFPERYLEWKKTYLKQNNIFEKLRKTSHELGKIGFISDNSIEAKKFYKKQLKKHNVPYKGLVVSEEIGVEKPNPQIFKEFLKQRNERPQEFAYFGNYVDRDQAAEKTGMKFVWVTEHYTFDSKPFNGVKINQLTFENIKKAVNQLK